MKKIILFLLVLFSLNIKVQASTRDVYYSKYSDFSDFTEVKVESSELIDVESERRYRWYKENITSEYLLYDDGINKYELVDLVDYTESEFSDWQYDQPTSITGRTIQEKEEYKVKKLKQVQSLMIGNFSFSKEVVYLGEIEIYVNNQKIDYDYICGNCNDENLFNENDFLLIDFYDPYYIKDITIKFINLEKEYINSFKIYAIEPMEIDVASNVYASYIYHGSEENNLVISEDDFNIVNPEYEEEIIYDELPEISSLDYVEVNTKYRYKDKYYYFYNIDDEYVEGYYVEYPEYIKDEDDYKDYYRYRTREKIVIENDMTITRYKESLEDFIVATTDYDIETDINYLQNGVYSVRYITPFQTITRQVTVDIEENDLRNKLEELTQKYNNLIDDYDFSQKQLEELKNDITAKDESLIKLENINISKEEKLISSDSKYKQLLKDYNSLNYEYQNNNREYNTEYISSLKEENDKCSNDLTNMKLRNEDNEKKLKLSNQANEYLEKSLLNIEKDSISIDKNNIIPFILIGLVIILLALFVIKKMSSEN